MSRSKTLRRALAALTRTDTLTTVLDLLGAGAVVTGAALIYAPAGFITAGAATLIASWSAAHTPAPAPPHDHRRDDT